MSGSGKTTFAFRYLLNVPAVCRFIFDDLGHASARLNLPHASTATEVEAALATRWVCFNPHRMFPGKVQDAFEWFCHWTLEASRRGRGKKVLLVDEVWRFCSSQQIPPQFASVAQMGRAEGLELVTCTQTPQRVNASITGQCTELVCFRLAEGNALDRVEDLGADRSAVAALPLGSFVAWNRLNGERAEGRLF